MNDLTLSDFDKFFEALWSYPPFAWQRDLARRVLTRSDRPWPEVIALPTASGKTACLDVAVFALASQAGRIDRGEALSAPRRVFFVVDRRIIVDEAFERAQRMARRLDEAYDGVLKDVANRLRLIADSPTPLDCYELRGGMYRSDAWARSPRQPTVIASTVDQLGSRLLFRSYGRSFKTWPLHAGLAGNDALILLDEAHCARPFMETLQAVAKYRTWAEVPLASSFHAVVMSATPPDGLNDVFADRSSESGDPNHPLGRRQLAAKPAGLVIVPNAKGRRADPEMAKALAAAAEVLVDADRRAVVVFANRVAIARETARLLSAKHGAGVVLLTGRMRPIDKDDTIADKLALLVSSASTQRKLEDPVFVVATQTLEVGADLDFDGLVTECASLDALRQRFGRLNRMGRSVSAKASILVRSDQTEQSDDDPVYGPSISETWCWMIANAGADGVIDFQIAGMTALLPKGEALARMAAPSMHAPVMLPAHVDCLAQTAPLPSPSPDVSLFLHGPTRDSADVHVCWRADIDLSDEEKASKTLDILTLCPPAAAECLPVPIWVLRRWLSGEDGIEHGADIEGESEPTDDAHDRSGDDTDHRCCVRWRGRDEASCTSDPRDVRPGDVVVIPASCSGAESLGDLAPRGDSGPVMDFGDRAFAQVRAKALLRLHPAVIAEWPDCATKSRFMSLAIESPARWAEDPDVFISEVRDALAAMEADTTAATWLRNNARSLRDDPTVKRTATLHPLGGIVLRGSRLLEHRPSGGGGTTDEDDVTASGTVDVTLERHLDGVGEKTRVFAEGCGFSAPLVNAVRCAAKLHDLGKADPRFQTLLRGGNPWASGDLLAKSGRVPQSRTEFEKARRAAGFPKGGRHELLSVRLLESDRSLLPEDEALTDLIRHLIESHHGYCRPFAPVVVDDGSVTTRLRFEGRSLEASTPTEMAKIDSGVAERFWRLTRRFGWWGLAWLEAIVRLADHRQSEAEEHGTGGAR